MGLAAIGTLAAALSALYWLPVLSQIGTIDTAALTTNFFDYHHRFLPLEHLVQSSWAYNFDYNPGTDAIFNLGRVQAILLVGAALAVALMRTRGYRTALGCGTAILLLVWLEQPGSVAVWDHFPPARFIQFPYRLSVDVTVCGALLLAGPAAGLVDAAWRGGRLRWPVRAGLGVALVALVALAAASLVGLPRTRTDLAESRVSLPMLWRLEADRQLVAASTQTDYLPLGVREPFFPTALDRPALSGPVVQAGASATLLQSSLFGLTARVEAARPTTLTFDWFAYPAWHATIDGRPVGVRSAPPLDLLRVDVPAGTHVLSLDADGTRSDHLGLALSAVALLVLLAMVVYPGAMEGSGVGRSPDP